MPQPRCACAHSHLDREPLPSHVHRRRPRRRGRRSPRPAWLRGPHAPPSGTPRRALDADGEAIFAAVAPVLLAGALPAAREARATTRSRNADRRSTPRSPGLPPAAQAELRAAVRAARASAGAPRLRARVRAVAARRRADGRARVPRPLPRQLAGRCCAPRTTRCISSRSPRGTAIRKSWPAIGYRRSAAAWLTRMADAISPIPSKPACARGWNVIDASPLERDLDARGRRRIVGTGAGGGTAAEILADAGLARRARSRKDR